MTELAARLRRFADAPTTAWIVLAAVAAPVAVVLLAYQTLALAAIAGLIAAVSFGVVSYRSPAVGIVGLIATAALDSTGRLGSVGGVVVTAYQAAVIVILIVSFLRARAGLDPVRATRVDLPVLLLVGSAAVGVPLALDSHSAIVTFGSLVSSAVLLYLVAQFVTTDARVRTVVWGLISIAAVLGVLAVGERVQVLAVGPVLKTTLDGIRATATFDDPNILGTFLAAATAYALAWALVQRGLFERLWSWACLFAIVAGLYVTYSRGAWLGALIACVIVVAVSPVSTRVKLGILFAGIGFGLVAAAALDPEWIRQKITGVTDNPSAYYRYHMFTAGLRMAADRPLGVGPGNFPLYFASYRDSWVELGLVESHIMYMTVLVEYGVTGFIGLMWLIWRYAGAIIEGLKRTTGATRALAAGSAGAATALLLQSFTYSLETSKFLWLTLGLGLVAAGVAAARNNKEEA